MALFSSLSSNARCRLLFSLQQKYVSADAAKWYTNKTSQLSLDKTTLHNIFFGPRNATISSGIFPLTFLARPRFLSDANVNSPKKCPKMFSKVSLTASVSEEVAVLE